MGECDARTHGATNSSAIGATEDAAARRTARPGSPCFVSLEALKAPCAHLLPICWRQRDSVNEFLERQRKTGGRAESIPSNQRISGGHRGAAVARLLHRTHQLRVRCYFDLSRPANRARWVARRGGRHT